LGKNKRDPGKTRHRKSKKSKKPGTKTRIKRKRQEPKEQFHTENPKFGEEKECIKI